MPKARFFHLKRRRLLKEKSEKRKCSNIEWAQILIGLFVSIAITVYTIIQTNNENSIAEENRRQDADLANQTRLNDIAIADNRAKETILNNYLKLLTELFEKDVLNLPPLDPIRFILQFNTFAVLSQLDSKRKSYLIRCFHEYHLITQRQGDSQLIDLTSANLIQLNLNGRPTTTQTIQSIFQCVSVANTDLTDSSFTNLDLSGTQFQRSIMTQAILSSTVASVIFCDDNKHQITSFNRAYLSKANFEKSIYAYVDFSGATMNNSNLRQFECTGCNFNDASLYESDMSLSRFPLKPSLSFISKDSGPTQFRNSDLSKCNLFQSTFENTSFVQSKLIEINAIQARFFQCDLSNVIMNNCILTQSQFNGSKLISTNLNNCKINKVYMINVDFSFSTLINVDFSDSTCYSCIFNNTNLTGINFQNSILDKSYFTNSIFNQQQLIKAKSILGIYL
ncbi:unnamed protein product [Adineta steineri]|uniref:Pentapeptide repeat-containing protein n=1 Tax=Adineta steineri TaxID=433720 RepID=A0A818M609_9BILA|nr:unnamed protein product [Adineta steineri]CAF0977744.1 unnamed protein product [Adineta steineri]CAF3582878.1 unnamed protein product [Adineta steineri]CAF3592455.1 unnamed protein product [Adineta steineri]